MTSFPTILGIPEIWYLRAFMILVLVMGGIISYYAYRTWRRTRLRPFFYMALGFALVSLGAALAGILFEIITAGDYLTAWVASASFTVVGFFSILYSLLTSSEEIVDLPGK